MAFTISGSRVIGTGTSVTTAGYYQALVNANMAANSFQSSVSNSEYVSSIFNHQLQLGTAALDGADSVWNASDEIIFIRGVDLDFFGEFRMGNADASGNSENGGTFSFSATGNDQWRLEANSKVICYGSNLKTSHRVLVAGANVETSFYDCNIEFEDGVDNSNNETGFVANYIRCFIHHTTAVGLKIFYSTGVLTGTRIVGCTYALQVGPTATPFVLVDLEIDDNTNHLVPNIGDGSNIVFINPDFTVLRTALSSSNDRTRLTFRYRQRLQNTSGVAQAGVRAYLTDQVGTVILNNTLSNASGEITGLPSFTSGGVSYDVLVHSNWQGTTGTVLADYTLSLVSLGTTIRQEIFTHDADVDSILFLNEDTDYDGTSETDINAYPFSISFNSSFTQLTITGNVGAVRTVTSQQIYNAVKLFMVNNFTGQSQERVFLQTSGTTLNCRALNVVLVNLTITGSVTTTGLITATSTAGVAIADVTTTISGNTADVNGDSVASLVLPDGYTVASLHATQSNADANIATLESGSRFRYQSATYGGNSYYFRVTGSKGEITYAYTFPATSGSYEIQVLVTSEITLLNQIISTLETHTTNINAINTTSSANQTTLGTINTSVGTVQTTVNTINSNTSSIPTLSEITGDLERTGGPITTINSRSGRLEGLIEDNNGDRFTTKALEAAPTGSGGGGGSAPTVTQISTQLERAGGPLATINTNVATINTNVSALSIPTVTQISTQLERAGGSIAGLVTGQTNITDAVTTVDSVADSIQSGMNTILGLIENEAGVGDRFTAQALSEAPSATVSAIQTALERDNGLMDIIRDRVNLLPTTISQTDRDLITNAVINDLTAKIINAAFLN